MSAIVRASCALCGGVDVPVADARLSCTVTGEDLRNVLTFECPSCGVEARQRVGERGTRLLSTAGITVVTQSSAAVDSRRGTTS